MPTINVLSKNVKNIKIFPMKFSILFLKKVCLLHGQVFEMIQTIKLPGLSTVSYTLRRNSVTMVMCFPISSSGYSEIYQWLV